jgi:hypothetical protein
VRHPQQALFQQLRPLMTAAPENVPQVVVTFGVVSATRSGAAEGRLIVLGGCS